MATMTFKNAQDLAAWIAKNNPPLFLALKKNAEARAHLAGITDFFSSIGSGLATATKQVGSFLTSEDGLKTLGALGGAYMAHKSQKEALQLQVKLAQAGQPLAPVTYGADPYGGAGAYYYPSNGAPVMMSSQLAQQLSPPVNWSRYLPFIIGGVGLFVLSAIVLSGGRKS